MTSTTDEINNLRAGLEHIRAWCAHEVKNGTPGPEAKGVFNAVHEAAVRALKTPRASVAPKPVRPPRPVVKADPGQKDTEYGIKGKGFCKEGCVP